MPPWPPPASKGAATDGQFQHHYSRLRLRHADSAPHAIGTGGRLWRPPDAGLTAGKGHSFSCAVSACSFSRITDIFISHLHGDHFLGLPGLLSTMALHQNGGTVTVHTFAEGERVLRQILNVFCKELSFDLKFDIIDPSCEGILLDGKHLSVEAFLCGTAYLVQDSFSVKTQAPPYRRSSRALHGRAVYATCRHFAKATTGQPPTALWFPTDASHHSTFARGIVCLLLRHGLRRFGGGSRARCRRAVPRSHLWRRGRLAQSPSSRTFHGRAGCHNSQKPRKSDGWSLATIRGLSAMRKLSPTKRGLFFQTLWPPAKVW